MESTLTLAEAFDQLASEFPSFTLHVNVTGRDSTGRQLNSVVLKSGSVVKGQVSHDQPSDVLWRVVDGVVGQETLNCDAETGCFDDDSQLSLEDEELDYEEPREEELRRLREDNHTLRAALKVLS